MFPKNFANPTKQYPTMETISGSTPNSTANSETEKRSSQQNTQQQVAFHIFPFHTDDISRRTVVLVMAHSNMLDVQNN